MLVDVLVNWCLYRIKLSLRGKYFFLWCGVLRLLSHSISFKWKSKKRQQVPNSISILNCQLSIVNSQSSIVNYQLSILNSQLLILSASNGNQRRGNKFQTQFSIPNVQLIILNHKFYQLLNSQLLILKSQFPISILNSQSSILSASNGNPRRGNKFQTQFWRQTNKLVNGYATRNEKKKNVKKEIWKIILLNILETSPLSTQWEW